jgi:hypothetical protein
MLNAMYNVRVNKIGINTGASYKINTSNRNKYTFGNKFSANSFVSYSITKAKTVFIPNVGVLFETTAANALAKQNIAQTGGNLLATAAGLEVSFKNFTIGGNIQMPLSQNFSASQTDLKARGMAHVTFSF